MLWKVLMCLQQTAAHLPHLCHTLPVSSLVLRDLLFIFFFFFVSSRKVWPPFAVIFVFSAGTVREEREIRMTFVVIRRLCEAAFFCVTSAQRGELNSKYKRCWNKQGRLIWFVSFVAVLFADWWICCRTSEPLIISYTSAEWPECEHKWVWSSSRR